MILCPSLGWGFRCTCCDPRDGMHLLDYLHFEALLALCEEQDRWSFMCAIAPLRLTAATGSPVNPIARLGPGFRRDERGFMHMLNDLEFT